jgi:hypothetical protein
VRQGLISCNGHEGPRKTAAKPWYWPCCCALAALHGHEPAQNRSDGQLTGIKGLPQGRPYPGRQVDRAGASALSYPAIRQISSSSHRPQAFASVCQGMDRRTTTVTTLTKCRETAADLQGMSAQPIGPSRERPGTSPAGRRVLSPHFEQNRPLGGACGWCCCPGRSSQSARLAMASRPPRADEGPCRHSP